MSHSGGLLEVLPLATRTFLEAQKTIASPTLLSHPFIDRQCGFLDSHLTFEQKQSFWSKSGTITQNGKHYQGNLFALGNNPDLARNIALIYANYCQHILTQSPPDTLFPARPPAPMPSDQNEYTEKTCVCGIRLAPAEKVYCGQCWLYFTLHAKRYEWWQQRQVSSGQLPQTGRGIPQQRHNASQQRGEQPLPPPLSVNPQQLQIERRLPAGTVSDPVVLDGGNEAQNGAPPTNPLKRKRDATLAELGPLIPTDLTAEEKQHYGLTNEWGHH